MYEVYGISSGLNGAWICNVNDDLDRDKRSKRNKANNYNKNNLPINETARRTERLVPPTTFWNTHGLSKHRVHSIHENIDFF